MQLGWENTMEDLVAFNKYHYKHSPVLRRRRQTLLAIVAVLEFLWFFWCFGWTHPELALLYLIVTFAIGILLGLCLRWLIGDRLIRRLYSREKNRSFFGAHELELTDEYLIHRTAYTDSKVAWGVIERIESTKDHTFIYVGTNSAVIIPHERITQGVYGVFMQDLGRRFKPDQPLPRQVPS